MEDINAAHTRLCPMRFAFDLNLSDERRDGLDGIRHGEKSDQRQAGIRQTRMNALADGPDLRFAGQGGERLDREIGHHVIELADQSLVGTEHDRADRICASGLLRCSTDRGGPACPESRRPSPVPRCDSSRPRRAPISRIVRCSMRPRPSSCGRRIADRRRCAIFRRRLCRGVAHGFSSAGGFGLARLRAWAGTARAPGGRFR